MNSVVLMAVLVVGVTLALPMPDGDVAIVRSENDNKNDGNFHWAYETSDGTKAEQTGEPKEGPLEDGTNGQFETMKGSYSYVAPDGRTVLVTYEADEKGYRAKTTFQ